MPLWQAEVEEVRHVTVLYTVSAATKEDALANMLHGSTLREREIKDQGVLERHCHGEPVLLKAVFLYELGENHEDLP